MEQENEWSFEALVEKTWKILDMKARKIAKGTSHHPDDLLSESLLSILKNPKVFSQPGKFVAYAEQRLRSKHSDWIRKETSQKRGGTPVQETKFVSSSDKELGKISNNANLRELFDTIVAKVLPAHKALNEVIQQLMQLRGVGKKSEKSNASPREDTILEDAKRRTQDQLIMDLQNKDSQVYALPRLVPLVREVIDPRLNLEIPIKKGKRTVTEKYDEDLNDVVHKEIALFAKGKNLKFTSLSNACFDKAFNYLVLVLTPTRTDAAEYILGKTEKEVQDFAARVVDLTQYLENLRDDQKHSAAAMVRAHYFGFNIPTVAADMDITPSQARYLVKKGLADARASLDR